MSESPFSFMSLTPNIILDAVDTTGIRVDSGLTPLNSYENRVYQFIDEKRKRYVVKFYRPQRWDKSQIIEEHQFLYQLAEQDIPVVVPLAIDGQTLHEHQNYFFSLYPSVGGRNYEIDNEQQLECVGRVLGRLHKSTENCRFVYRPTIGLNEYLYQPRQILEKCTLIPEVIKSAFLTMLDNLINTVILYWKNDWHSLRLHGDCHAGNILWQDGPLLVDFDDSRNGPAIQDIWMLLHGNKQEQLIQLDILLEAYSEFAELNYNEINLIEPLRTMRSVHYLAWIVKRWDDPAFPANFVWMTDETFWRNQLSLFNEHINLLKEPPLQLLYQY